MKNSNSRPPNKNFNRSPSHSGPRRDGPRRDGPRPPRTCPDVARNAAAMLLWLVLDEKQSLDEAMNNLSQYSQLDGRDRGFAAMVVKSTLRYLGHVEKLLNAQLERPLPETANYVRALLRSALGQHLAKIAPPHAIIDRAVSLAKYDKKAFGMAGLVNAVLRRCFDNIDKVSFDDIELLPKSWSSRYIAAYGEEKTRKIAQSVLIPAPIDLTIKPNLSPEEIAQIEQDFVGTRVGSTIRIPTLPDDFQNLPSWLAGNIWVQDYAASLPALLLGVKKGQNVLDMCAAPGGKAMQMAAVFANVSAVDVNENRIKLIAQNIARTNLHAKLLAGNAKNFAGENQWDAILLDAPCSATGTLRRNLESPWIKLPFDLPKLMEIQCELIRAAAQGLKSGAKLVYAVCSMEPEEAELAVSSALEAGLIIDKISKEEVPLLHEAIEERGTLRILPYMLSDIGGLDGFFIARFVKP